MARYSFFWVALLSIILTFTFNPQPNYKTLPPDQGTFDETARLDGLIANQSTPTPTDLQNEGTSSPPPTTRARQRAPGLVAGAIIIVLIIIIGVLRYSRRR